MGLPSVRDEMLHLQDAVLRNTEHMFAVATRLKKQLHGPNRFRAVAKEQCLIKALIFSGEI